MDQIVSFVENWGYLAVLLGSMVEGESIILTASYFAYTGVLSLPKVMFIAFIGTLFADQGLYFIGRHYGPSIIKRHPRFQARADKAFNLLHRWDIWFILSFRFIYGIRTISPVVIGASGLSPRRFIPYNFLAALIWTLLSCGGGFLLGGAIEQIIDHFHVVQYYFLGILGLLILLYSIYRLFFKKSVKESS